MPLKILSDFDGVWTDQAIEAESVKLYMVAEAARMARVPSNRALADFAGFEVRTRSAPDRYGWAPDGRVTAWVDEDPFCIANSIAMYLAEAAGPVEARYRGAILDGGFDTVTAFADHCFMTATENFRTLHPPALVPETREVIEALHARGVELVVVSNSSPDKLITWFRAMGIDAGEGADHVLRIRGSAGKFILGETDASITVGERRIYVDRPKYRAIIGEERPDLIIGDVFSLDLALPHVMRAEGAPGAPHCLVLRRHEHTPAWIIDTRADGAVDHVVDGVGDLLKLAERVAART